MHDDLLSRWQATIDQGTDQYSIIQMMHDAGVSIGLCIKYVTDLYKIRLSEAKILVAGHPCWKQVHDAHHQLHTEVAKDILNDEQGNEER